MPEILVGTSGYSYDHWIGPFYPENLQRRKWLEYYSKSFSTVEMNSTFYHLPKEQTVKNWARAVPENFLFSVKCSRFITHIKKLIDLGDSLDIFFERTQGFGHKQGSYLYQLPPSFKRDDKRLEEFLERLPDGQHVVEFRHQSWLCPGVYKILRKYKVALCLVSMPRFPEVKEVTAKFSYVRFHGKEQLYGSKYSDTELKRWSQTIRALGVPAYVYFNNDFHGFAVENAITLIKLLKPK